MMRPRTDERGVRREAVEACALQIQEVVPRAMRLLRGEMRRERPPYW